MATVIISNTRLWYVVDPEGKILCEYADPVRMNAVVEFLGWMTTNFDHFDHGVKITCWKEYARRGYTTKQFDLVPARNSKPSLCRRIINLMI